MSRDQLKILAVVSMMIDHVGAVFFPQIKLLRIIGRLAFPIFAFLISEGLFHTSNIKAYLKRLFVFALISEVPYDLAFHGVFYYPKSQNIFFTLFLGLLEIALLQAFETRNFVVSAALISAAALLAEILHTDYSWFGVLTIFAFYSFRKYKTKGAVSFSALNIGYSLLHGALQGFAVAADIPILLYNGKKGKFNWKYFFYAFYPVHLLLLFFIHMVVN